MSKIKTYQNLSEVTSWEELKRFASASISQIIDEINGRLTLTENVKTSLVTMEFPSATQIRAVHTLGRVPIGYIQVGASAAITVYDGTTANDFESIYLRSTGAGTVNVLVF